MGVVGRGEGGWERIERSSTLTVGREFSGEIDGEVVICSIDIEQLDGEVDIVEFGLKKWVISDQGERLPRTAAPVKSRQLKGL